MQRLTRNSRTSLAYLVALGSALSACSSSHNDGGSTGVAAGASSNGGGSSGGSSSSAAAGSDGSTAQGGSVGSAAAGSDALGGAGIPGLSSAGASGIPTNACPGLPFDTSMDAGTVDAGMACTGVSVEAESVPVDMFIMMDRSQSMGFTLPNSTMTRWDALKAAVQAFVQAPAAAAVGAGIGFFGRSGGADDTLDCDVNGYATPAIAIGPLATVGASLVNAIDQTPPAGLTPTVPALQGALSYAEGWAAAHTGRATIVVLVTDGFPTQCSSQPADIATAAQAGYDSAQHIKTYVIGVGDVAKFNLDNYAQAGGTQTAFLTDEANVSDTFVQALLNISDSKLACQYTIPKPTDPTMQLDTNKVQVVYTPASGDPLEVPRVSGPDACATATNGGWYYDNPTTPSSIAVCPCTCSSFAAGRVDVRLGCSPRISLR